MKGGAQYGWLLALHLSFAIPFLIFLLLLRFWTTSIKQQRYIRPFLYFCLIVYVGAFLTGFTMLMPFF